MDSCPHAGLRFIGMETYSLRQPRHRASDENSAMTESSSSTQKHAIAASLGAQGSFSPILEVACPERIILIGMITFCSAWAMLYFLS